MFPKLYYRVWGIQSKLCSIFGGTPLVWDPKKQKVIITPRSKLLFYIYLFAIYSIGVGYLGLRFLSIRLWGSMRDVGFPLALFTCGVFNANAATLFLPRPEAVAGVINATLKFAVDFTQQWKPGFQPWKDKLTKYFTLGCCVLSLATVFCPYWVAAHYIIFPFNPAYPFSFLPKEYVNIWTFVAWAIFYIWILHGIWSSICTVALILGTMGFIVYVVLKEFVANSRVGYATISRLRTRTELPRVYREFEMSIKYFNFIFEHSLVPAQAICTQICLACNFVLVTQWSHLDAATASILIMWSFGAFAVWSFALVVGSYIFMKSRKILSSWKFFDWSRGEKKYLGKFKKGCRPLAIRAGGYFCIRRLSVLKFWQGIVRGTFRALLTLKK